MLLLEDVTVRSDERTLLADANLIVRRGERLAMMTGDPIAGAAVIGLFAGQRTPSSGRVRIDGLDPVRHAELLRGRCMLVRGGGDDAATDRIHRMRRLALDPDVDVWLIDDLAPSRSAGGLDVLLGLLHRRHEIRPPTALLVTADRRLASRHCDRAAELLPPHLAPAWDTTPTGRLTQGA